MTDRLLLEDKVALITGAAGGIGSATAKLFARHGAITSLFDRDATELQAVAEECDKITLHKNKKALAFVGDITDDDCCHRYVEDTVKSYGKIDILINCAGIAMKSNIDKFKMDVFDKVMAVNLRSLVVMSSLAIPHLKQTQGNIVSISSITAHRIFHGMSYYAASKAAVKTFTEYSASELAQYKVRINCLSPAFIDTAMNRDPMLTDEDNKKVLDSFGRRHAVNRVGLPEEVAQSILFLASDTMSSFITGSDLLIDGGYSIFYENPAASA